MNLIIRAFLYPNISLDINTGTCMLKTYLLKYLNLQWIYTLSPRTLSLLQAKRKQLEENTTI